MESMIIQKFAEIQMSQLIAITIINLCILAIFISVIANFILGHKRSKDNKQEKKSIVETGTMTLFFIIIYWILKTQTGIININSPKLQNVLIIVGIIVMIIGTIINVKGRFNLGKNWANQVTIYKDQTFVRQGVYNYFRHPLYASIIWMFYASSIIYSNYVVFFATTFVFLPFMYYRAKQEEKMLSKRFKEYKQYQKEVGMFFFKF